MAIVEGGSVPSEVEYGKEFLFSLCFGIIRTVG